MFESLSDGLQSAFKSIRGKGKLTEANMRDGLQMVEQAMLEADVSYQVVQDFMAKVTQAAMGQKVLLSLRPHEELVRIVHQELIEILGPVDVSIPIKAGQVTVLMLCGLQGAGKTTTCGKLSQLLKEQKASPFLVAADLQRPAAIQQLHTLGEQLGVPVYSDLNEQDPVKVCRAGVAKAKEQGANVVILDTAGRLAIDDELMKQLCEIDKKIGPDQVYLVVDGMTGQDAVNSASAFNSALELDGVIMTKLDGDARGGALLSVKHVTQVPVKFIGTGEHLDALEAFRPEGMAGRILEMGDIVAVAQEAHRIIDDGEREKLEARMASGQFTLEDFRGVLEKIAKPGLMQKMMSLMPGMGDMKKMLAGGDTDGEVRKMLGVIDSMTTHERRNWKLIDTPRRQRIAQGAGVQPTVVNALIKQFSIIMPMMQMAAGGNSRDRMQMMQQMQSSMMSGDPSMGGMKLKKGTGKRLNPKEKARLQRERDKLLRKQKRKK
ncbi:signal recognition particle protein [Aureliella helgolandensis]|uniref:signal-recognition-particle GTPase n=1 Tax=Aureliella helgolandensis TaxID=2527968 RepID=A0A518GFN6_9BACT|nr:signal recognition particle protein [Aureliella helgolandensis]QDV27395.1 Signal recognition particle protein [Aureliella helgolandensis]